MKPTPAPACALVILLLAALLPFTAAGAEIEILAHQADVIEVAPHEIVSLGFQVRSDLSERALMASEAVLPEDWRLLTPELPFELPAGGSAARLLHLEVPEHAPAGEYTLIYSVWRERRPDVRAEVLVRLAVRPVRGLEITVMEVPPFVAAGDPYGVTFTVRNTSNTRLAVALEAGLRPALPGHPPALSLDRLELEPGQSARVAVTAATDPAVKQQARSRLELVALGPDGLRAAGSSSVEVLPRVAGIAGLYRTVPARAAVHVLGRSGDDSGLASQAELSGGGPVGEGGAGHVSFRFLGPNDTREVSALGREDTYSLSYWNRKLRLDLGDAIYRLTPLTELGRSGRGAGVTYGTPELTGSAFWFHDRYVSRDQAGGRVSSQLLEWFGLEAGLLHRGQAEEEGWVANGDEDEIDVATAHATLASVRTRLGWPDRLLAEIELARQVGGERSGGQAWQAELSARTGPVRLRGSLLRADPDYDGYYHDVESRWASAEIGLPAHLRLRGSYRWQERDLEPEAGDRPDQDADARLAFERLFGDAFRIGLVAEDRQDRRYDPGDETDLRRTSGGVEAAWRDRRASLLASVQFGTLEDRVLDRSGDVALARLAASYRPSSLVSLRAGATYQQDALEIDERELTLEAGGSARLAGGLALGGEFQWERDEDQGETRERTLAQLELTWNMGWGGTLEGLARHSSHDAEFDLWTRTSVPFDIPYQRRPDLGRLEGRLIDPATGLGIAGVRVTTGAAVAVSDREGRFEFRSLAAGPQVLAFDPAGPALGLVSLQDMPVPVTIESGRTAEVRLELVPGASITGRLMVAGWAGSEQFAQPAGMNGAAAVRPEPRTASPAPLAGATVTLTSGTTVIRRLTGADGGFALHGLRPGVWTVAVEAGLPENTALEGGPVRVELAAGEQGELELRGAPVVRTLRLQQQGDTPLELRPR